MNTILFVGEHTRTFDVPRHAREHWEIVYCTDGSGTFLFTNGTTIQYRAGEAVAIPPGEAHSNVSTEGFSNIHMTMDSPSFPYRTAFRVNDAEGYLLNAFMQAKHYYLSDIKKRELLLSALGDLISGYMIVYRSNNEYSEPVEAIRGMITRSYASADFALDEMIRQMPMNYDYLRKLFKKEVGCTPLEYLTNLRMKKAEMMLTAMWTKDYSVAEIARLCGFDDALYFSRVFKKHFGCSPSIFAKRQSKQNSTAVIQE